jgi:hypothetical protein
LSAKQCSLAASANLPKVPFFRLLPALRSDAKFLTANLLCSVPPRAAEEDEEDNPPARS